MSEDRRKFKHETSEQRKLALIEATLSLVSAQGVRGASVRGISERANVTQGLIRHYFSSKEGLIAAAYAHHMNYMTDLTFAPVAGKISAQDRLATLVHASLTPPVVEPRSIALWASFLNEVQRDLKMKAIHEQTYANFRDRLENLIRTTLEEAGRPASATHLRYLATACNALIDGLWLEGGSLPDAFEPGELPNIGLESVGAIIGINLKMKADQP